MRRPANLWGVMAGLLGLLVLAVAVVGIGVDATTPRGRPVWPTYVMCGVVLLGVVVESWRKPWRHRRR